MRSLLLHIVKTLWEPRRTKCWETAGVFACVLLLAPSPAPAQSISSIWPVGVTAAGAACTGTPPCVTIAGMGFTCSSQILWNSTPIAPNPTSCTGAESPPKLTFQIPAGYAAIPDVVQIAVQNGPHGTPSNTVPFYIAGTIGLASVVDQPVSGGSNSNNNMAISGDGRFVAFVSVPSNSGNVFLRIHAGEICSAACRQQTWFQRLASSLPDRRDTEILLLLAETASSRRILISTSQTATPRPT